jgi:hypothetical protein
MAVLILQTNPDGTVAVAAPAGPLPPELMADAEQAASLDEALTLVGEVLGAEGEGKPVTGEQPPAGASAAAPATDDPEAAMQQGYANVRGQPR